nr:hypothetical protein [Tanacetum cinerariifolium]
MSSHTTRYISLALTQKVFANIRRVGKGCSGIETPLFENILEVREVDAEEEVQVFAHDDVDQENVTEEIAADVAQPTSPLPPSPIIPSSPPHQSPRTSPSQAAEGTSILVQQVLDKCSALVHRGRISVDIDEGIELVDDQEKDDQEKDAQVKGRQADTQAEIYNIDLDHTSKVLSMQEDSEVQEVVEVVNAAKFMTKVATTAASIPIPAAEPVVATVSTPISAVKPKVLKVVTAATTQVVSAAEPVVATVSTPISAVKPKVLKLRHSLLKIKAKVEDPNPMKKKDQIAMDAEYARKLQEEEESLAQAKDAQATDVQPKDAPAKGIQYIRRYHGYKKKPQSEFEACKNMIAYLKNTKVIDIFAHDMWNRSRCKNGGIDLVTGDGGADLVQGWSKVVQSLTAHDLNLYRFFDLFSWGTDFDHESQLLFWIIFVDWILDLEEEVVNCVMD